MILSPLEQFEIITIIPAYSRFLDISFTNSSFIMILGVILFLLLLLMVTSYGVRTIVPNRWQVIVESVYETILEMVNDNIGSRGKKFFPFIFTLFTFILISNLIGLIPYSFTITSHLVVTLTLSMIVFVGINIICLKEHGIKMLGLFLPPGSDLGLAPLLVPIEFISYIFRLFSLAVRLFANMMAGHTLLKVIAGFAWSMMAGGTILFISHFIPLIVLVVLIGLELGVALIQAYVFTILTCIYLNEAVNLH
jgi:ATP synthase subunit 6